MRDQDPQFLLGVDLDGIRRGLLRREPAHRDGVAEHAARQPHADAVLWPISMAEPRASSLQEAEELILDAMTRWKADR